MAILGLVGLVGCGSSGSGSHYTAAEQQPTTQTTVYSGGGDVDIQDVDIGTNGTYIDGNGNVVAGGNVTAGGDFAVGQDGPGTSDNTNESDEAEAGDVPNPSPANCAASGYNYCPIVGKCTTKLGGSSCGK